MQNCPKGSLSSSLTRLFHGRGTPLRAPSHDMYAKRRLHAHAPLLFPLLPH
jgi:hypothetical protein